MCCFADDGSFSPSMISTAGVDCRVKSIKLADQSAVSLQIWDTAGLVTHIIASCIAFFHLYQTNADCLLLLLLLLYLLDKSVSKRKISHLIIVVSLLLLIDQTRCSLMMLFVCRMFSITRQYYRGAMGIMLVFDCTSQSSFAHIEYWLNNIAQFAHASVARVLVCNKCDMTEQRTVSKADAEALAKHFNIPYFECSAKSNTGVNESFTQLTEMIMPNIHLFTAKPNAEETQATINLAEQRRKKEKESCAAKCR